MLAHLRARGVFTVKMGPQLVVRRWQAETVKAAIAAGGARRLKDIPADSTDVRAEALARQLAGGGWEQAADAGSGFGDFQPRYVFQVPLAGTVPGRAARPASTSCGGATSRRPTRPASSWSRAATTTSPRSTSSTSRRPNATSSRRGPLHYFQRMWQAMRAEDPDRIRLYLARHDGQLLAATTWVKVGGHVWYSYGASSTDGREHRASNAVQWRMICDAADAGAGVYDLRGISDTLDPDDHLFGLIQFKLGTGGEAVEYLGEWDYPLSPFLHKAFKLYLARRR